MLSLVLLTVFLTAAGAGGPLQGTASEPASVSGASLSVLSPSGVRVLLAPRAEASTVAVACAYRVGGALDGAATCGSAHLLEHLILYRGTELSSAESCALRWRELGASPRGKAYPDYTCFAVSVAPENLFAALELLREQLLHPSFSEAELQLEREVVAAELLARSEDPALRAYRLANQALFGEDNYGLPTEGYVRTIKELSRQTLCARFEKHYTPSRLTVAIAGRFDPAVTAAFLRDTFGLYPPQEAGPLAAAPLPPLPEVHTLVEAAPVSSAQLIAAFRGPPASHRDWLPFCVVAHMLAGGTGSRLPLRLVHQEGVAEKVELMVEPRSRCGLALVRCVTGPEELMRCRRELKRALGQFTRQTFDPEVVERGVNSVVVAFAQETESPGALASELVMWDMLGDWTVPLAAAGRLSRITREELARVAELYFAPQLARYVAVVPEGMKIQPEKKERALRPERRVVKEPFALLAQSLPNSKVCSFALCVWGGLAGDGPGEEGLGGLVARTILCGRQGELPEAFADRLYRWGVRAEAGTTRDYSFVRFSGPDGAFEDTLQAVAAACIRPNLYDPTTLEKVRREIAAETLTFPSLTEAAERVLWERAFGGTPYGVFPPGRRQSIEALRVRLRVKATQYWEKWWRPENFAAAVAGPRRADELIDLVRRAFAPFSHWGPGTRWPVDFPLPDLKPRTVIVNSELPEAVVLFAWFSPQSGPATVASFQVARELLVGAPGSRLWKLRQEEGLLYHLSGKVVVTGRVVGLQVLVIVPVGKLALALTLLQKEFQRLSVEQVGQKELAMAHLAITQRNRAKREESLTLVQQEAWHLLMGWPSEAISERLRGMTPSSFAGDLRRFFRTGERWTVAVGPERALRKVFQRANSGGTSR